MTAPAQAPPKPATRTPETSTGPSAAPDSAALAAFKALPRPNGTAPGEVLAIFTDKKAPSQWALERCDQDFLTHSASYTTLDESRALASNLVASDPAAYHWCFYSKVLDAVLPSSPGAPAKKPSSVFLNSIATAMKEKFEDTSYLAATEAIEKMAAEAAKASAPADADDFKTLPHANGLEIGDVMRVFTDKRAPALVSMNDCDAHFIDMMRKGRRPEDLVAALQPEVKAAPSKHHWCFYTKLLEMRMPPGWNAPAPPPSDSLHDKSSTPQNTASSIRFAPRNEKAARDTYFFLSALGRAFHNEFKIDRYMDAAKRHYARSTAPVEPGLLPHPEGTDLGDVLAIFTEKFAPSPDEMTGCDQEFLQLQEEIRDPTTLRRAIARAIRADPGRYHWCVYTKILEATDPTGDVAANAGQERDDRILGAFLFVSKVATAFLEEFGDPRYKIAAITHYRDLSRKAFFRSVETLPSTTQKLVRSYALPEDGAADRKPAAGGRRRSSLD